MSKEGLKWCFAEAVSALVGPEFVGPKFIEFDHPRVEDGLLDLSRSEHELLQPLPIGMFLTERAIAQ